MEVGLEATRLRSLIRAVLISGDDHQLLIEKSISMSLSVRDKYEE